MSTLRMYSVLDKTQEEFAPPFFAPTNAFASRMLKKMANERGNPLNDSPDDYSCWLLGEFDTDTGMVLKVEAPVCVVQVSALMENLEVPSSDSQLILPSDPDAYPSKSISEQEFKARAQKEAMLRTVRD